ncbi:MAG: PDZ domain-containing protein, partial [Bacteroidota bacterium]
MNHLTFLMKKGFVTGIMVLLAFQFLSAQNLKRQVMLGIRPTNLTEGQATSLGLPNTEGIYIQSILPATSAEEIGLQAEDVVLMINDFDVVGLEDLKTALQPLREGDPIKVGIWRGGAKKLLKGTLKGKPQETSAHGDIIYDEVAFEDGYLRALVNKPKSEKEKLPAVLLIPGYPCASVDGLPGWHPYKQLVEAFAERGYVVMRIEKTGLGDCMDTPLCDEIEIETEAAGFAAGFA